MHAILARACAALVVVLAVPAVHADVVWLCGLSEDMTRIVCVADPPEDAMAPVATAQVNGTTFPLDPRKKYTVDLWSPATELDRVELLARATICYRSPGCQVVFTHPPQMAVARR